MSELSIEQLSWHDKQRVLQLHPNITIQGMTPAYRDKLNAAKARRAECRIVPIERRVK